MKQGIRFSFFFHKVCELFHKVHELWIFIAEIKLKSCIAFKEEQERQKQSSFLLSNSSRVSFLKNFAH
jgi:hypothetical protein